MSGSERGAVVREIGRSVFSSIVEGWEVVLFFFTVK